jgi:hypothetical protein
MKVVGKWKKDDDDNDVVTDFESPLLSFFSLD